MYQDAAHINVLSKADMIEFFQHYISPSSPARAKLCIHMYAKGVSGVFSPAETTTQEIIKVAKKGSAMFKVGTDLAKEINGVGSHEDTLNGVSPKPYVIDNVRDFKSRLAVSTGARPVKDLSEFEELDSKL